jgi:type II restriction enzyme
VEENPDDPERPVNSPKWCYRVRRSALDVITGFGSSAFEETLASYLIRRPGLVTQYESARTMNRIPVTLPDGSPISLSPGGQNVLIKAMVEQFCSRFTPGGVVLYAGDADTKWAVFEGDALARLGVVVEAHGKMPDLVVHLPQRNWLVLLEAASTHGPVDGKRLAELKALFRGSTAGLVFVSCFPSRAEMRKYLAQIAWETEVWCADSPTHLVHFNGERFLGPYP